MAKKKAAAAHGPVVIEAAINGTTTKDRNPNAPRSPDEIATDALACIDEVVTTDSVPQTKPLNNLTVLSVAPLFAEAISRIHEGESVSRLFSDERTYGD